MITKYYGLYDTVAKNLVNVFVAQNDEVAVRSVEHIIKDPKTDISLIRDCILQYIYSVDTELGAVVDVQKNDIVTLSTLIDKVGRSYDVVTDSELLNKIDSLEMMVKGYQELDTKCQKILDLFSQSLSKIDKKVDDIIGGKIKCQKYKKR